MLRVARSFFSSLRSREKDFVEASASLEGVDMVNSLPVDKGTFMTANEETYRGLQYDMLEFLCNRQDAIRNELHECDSKYVGKQWIKERKLLIVGVLIGFGVVSKGSSMMLFKLIEFLHQAML
jgi:hypothetical protein